MGDPPATGQPSPDGAFAQEGASGSRPATACDARGSPIVTPLLDRNPSPPRDLHTVRSAAITRIGRCRTPSEAQHWWAANISFVEWLRTTSVRTSGIMIRGPIVEHHDRGDDCERGPARIPLPTAGHIRQSAGPAEIPSAGPGKAAPDPTVRLIDRFRGAARGRSLPARPLER